VLLLELINDRGELHFHRTRHRGAFFAQRLDCIHVRTILHISPGRHGVSLTFARANHVAFRLCRDFPPLSLAGESSAAPSGVSLDDFSRILLIPDPARPSHAQSVAGTRLHRGNCEGPCFRVTLCRHAL
jgi:hypothetical protein